MVELKFWNEWSEYYRLNCTYQSLCLLGSGKFHYISSILKPNEQVTSILSGEKYSTLSFIIPLIRNFQTCLIKKIPTTEIGENLKISLHSAITKRLWILEANKTAAKSQYKKAGFVLEDNAQKAAQ